MAGVIGTRGKEVDGKKRISSMPYLYDISEGNVEGHSSFVKLGFNDNVDNLEEDMWTQGAKYIFPNEPMQMEVASGNVADDVNGTGIQKVKVYYLNAAYEAKVEEVELTGGGNTDMVACDIFRVNAVRASRVGTGKVAAGLITVRHITSSPIYRTIATGYTRGRGLIYTVPKGKTLYITDINIASGSAAGGHYTRYTLRANYDDQINARTEWFAPLFEMTIQDQGMHIPMTMPIKVPETCDLVMSVISDGGAADAICQCAIRGWTE